MPRFVKRLVLWILPLLVIGAGWYFWKGRQAEEAPQWRMVAVSKGDITATVGATGTLGAIRTVEVGTQVSGQIVELKADFNDHVRKGQLIARLDDTLLRQAALQSEAELNRAKADLEYKRYLLEQSETLATNAQLSQTDLKAARLAVTQAESALTSASAGLDHARRNLAYAEILAPISGVIIDRTVELGQTVAASLSAPQLFLIAEDLSRMQILASVDESDISQVHEGQVAEFTVQAWPDRHFRGVVRQIRMQPTSNENVINYTVVVETKNEDGALLPGMTATLDFIVSQASQVLTVPNAALRFTPSEEVLASLRQARQADGGKAQPGDSGQGRERQARQTMSGGGPGGPVSLRGSKGTSGNRTGTDRLWVLDDQERLRPVRVETGLTDGTSTQVSGEGLSEGMEVIAGQITGAASGKTSGRSANPFQSQQSSGPAGPPRGGF